MDGRVAVTVSLGVLGASLALPFVWHFAMVGGYSWMMLQALTGQGTAMPVDAFTTGLFAFLFVGKLVGTLATGIGGGAAAVACARALRGDESLLFRAAGIAVGAAVLGFVGSVFTFDCLGAMVQTVPLVVAVITVALVARRARELRDAEHVS